MIPRSRKKKPRRPPADTSTWPKREHLEPDDLEGFREKVQQAFGWSELPRTHQAGAIEAQLFGNSVLVHAGTGSGKTAIAAGPHVHEKSKGKVTIMVSPLIALQEEQVQTFEEEYKLSAVAVNSAHGGCSPELMTNSPEKICSGAYQIVVISPEMLLSKRFIRKVLKNAEFSRRVFSVVIDEAHVISHWGSGFRKQYGRLGILRTLLPKGTPIVAMSATLPPRVQRDVLQKLQFGNADYITINLGNDRPNVSIVVRAIQNPMNTYSDVDFLIPDGITEASQIPKAFVYADNVSTGPEMEHRLYERVPDNLRDQGLIRPYSAAFTKEYRAELMRLFKLGIVRILICTDAAGMGCNIPDVDIVVQWKLPANVSSFVQRGGRAARAAGRTGLAVLLVEKSAYEADLSKLDVHHQSEAGNSKKGRKAAGVRQPGNYPKATKEYATLHGVSRGGHGGSEDNKQLAADDVLIDFDAPDEGLYSLVQTVRCRRRILTKIFGNDEPRPTVPCCDLCNPELLARTRPRQAAVIERTAAVKQGEPNEAVKKALRNWRTLVKARDFPDSLIGVTGILKDETVELLSSVGPIGSKQVLERVLGGRWLWFEKYGDRLLEDLQKLDIPPMQPKPKQTRNRKRVTQELNEVQDGPTSAPVESRKRQRKEAPTPSPATQRPHPSNQVTPRALHASTSRSIAISSPPTAMPATPLNYSHYTPQQYAYPPPYYHRSMAQAYNAGPMYPSSQATPTPLPRSQNFNPYINYYLSTPRPLGPSDPPLG